MRAVRALILLARVVRESDAASHRTHPDNSPLHTACPRRAALFPSLALVDPPLAH